MPRPAALLLSALLALSVGFSFFKLVLTPDPAAGVFAKAQQLEANGQAAMALRHYQLIVDTQPDSFYAPRALMGAGNLLAARARSTGSQTDFQDALDSYTRLARLYPGDALAQDALLDAGDIATDNLKNFGAARGIYQDLLRRAATNPDLAATATLKLGRLALDQGDAAVAQAQLQTVLQRWSRLEEQASEAQYHLGVVYETLLKKKDWASRAYEAVIARYPNSTWANDARERLGLIVFSDTRGQRPARRVMLLLHPIPDEGQNNGSLWGALRPLLAARGLDVDQTALRGWSMVPFIGGLDIAAPGKVVTPGFDPFENAIANAGMRFTVKSGGNEKGALRDLQDEIDNAGQPLVYLDNGSSRRWVMVIGYDSDRGEVMLQNRGARFDTLAAHTFATQWKVTSPLGGGFTLLSFNAPEARPVAKPSLTPTPTAAPLPGETPMPQLLSAPLFTWQLPQLSLKTANRAAVAHAGNVLRRSGTANVLLNADALSYLGETLRRLASGTETAASNALPEASSTPTTTETESPYDPTPAPMSLDRAGRGGDARSLLAFFGAPAREWSARRREGAAFLDAAGRSLGDNKLTGAATLLRASASALDEAADNCPKVAELSTPLSAGDRNRLSGAADAVLRARDAERAAAAAIAIQ